MLAAGVQELLEGLLGPHLGGQVQHTALVTALSLQVAGRPGPCLVEQSRTDTYQARDYTCGRHVPGTGLHLRQAVGGGVW